VFGYSELLQKLFWVAFFLRILFLDIYVIVAKCREVLQNKIYFITLKANFMNILKNKANEKP
jgi:hypothetical protein